MKIFYEKMKNEDNFLKNEKIQFFFSFFSKKKALGLGDIS